jgi:hypothetical protein
VIDTLRLYEDLSESLEPAAARKIASVVGSVYEELSQAVTKTDLQEVRDVVGELAQAQQRTEERLGELVQAQQRTEERLGELAQAQQRTETEIRTLTRSMKQTRQMVAGLSDTVGYTLENRAMERLPAILGSEHGITVEQPLVRRFVEYPDGGVDEVNVYGRGRRNGTEVTLVGEAKARPGKGDVDRFLELVSRLERNGWIAGEPFLLLIGHSIRPEVERYARSRNVEVLPSYLFGG